MSEEKTTLEDLQRENERLRDALTVLAGRAPKEPPPPGAIDASAFGSFGAALYAGSVERFAAEALDGGDPAKEQREWLVGSIVDSVKDLLKTEPTVTAEKARAVAWCDWLAAYYKADGRPDLAGVAAACSSNIEKGLPAPATMPCPWGICDGDGKSCCDVCSGEKGFHSGGVWMVCSGCEGKGYHVCDHDGPGPSHLEDTTESADAMTEALTAAWGEGRAAVEARELLGHIKAALPLSFDSASREVQDGDGVTVGLVFYAENGELFAAAPRLLAALATENSELRKKIASVPAHVESLIECATQGIRKVGDEAERTIAKLRDRSRRASERAHAAEETLAEQTGLQGEEIATLRRCLSSLVRASRRVTLVAPGPGYVAAIRELERVLDAAETPGCVSAAPADPIRAALARALVTWPDRPAFSAIDGRRLTPREMLAEVDAGTEAGQDLVRQVAAAALDTVGANAEAAEEL